MVKLIAESIKRVKGQEANSVATPLSPPPPPPETWYDSLSSLTKAEADYCDGTKPEQGEIPLIKESWPQPGEAVQMMPIEVRAYKSQRDVLWSTFQCNIGPAQVVVTMENYRGLKLDK